MLSQDITGSSRELLQLVSILT